MADLNTIIGKPYKASWTAKDEDLVDIHGVTDMGYTDGGQMQTIFADGGLYPVFAYATNKTETMTLTTSDLSLLSATKFYVGTLGKFIGNMLAQTNDGHAFAGTNNIKFTLGGGDDNVIISDIQANGSQGTPASLAFTFEATSQDGVTSAYVLAVGAITEVAY